MNIAIAGINPKLTFADLVDCDFKAVAISPSELQYTEGYIG